ncbi:DUF4268 domain-containing protein [Mucilaginibacter sp. P25]|uniref:DUF4268 domain-containing protein n=1 Tax=unclassified Mucilaginibacter TaxID=2617802 RepID=UPI003D66D83B
MPLTNPGKLYSKEQATQLKQAFWTAFGQYLKPQLSADGLRTNWVNYKTGIKYLYFKMEADKKSAFIAIEMNHPDADIQQLMFDQFVELKNVLSSQLEEEWDWDLHTTDEYGKTVSRVIKTLPHVSVFKQEDWPALISFLNPASLRLMSFGA